MNRKWWKRLAIAFTGLVAVYLLTAGVLAYIEVNSPQNASTTATSTVTEAVKPTPPTVDELLRLVNAERAKVGVAPLTLDERLNQSAQRKADDMTEYGYFDHVSPNDGRHGFEYIADTGIYCETDSENLTQNTLINDARHAFDAWVASEAHHSAMVDPAYDLTGFGISGNYVVQHFCNQ